MKISAPIRSCRDGDAGRTERERDSRLFFASSEMFAWVYTSEWSRMVGVRAWRQIKGVNYNKAARRSHGLLSSIYLSSSRFDSRGAPMLRRDVNDLLAC